MDRFDSMRLFARVVERRSFTAAAADLGVPRSTATEAIRQLETRLGARLLARTTRTVQPTLEGDVYYQHCLSILADVEDAEAGLGGAQPRGLLRIDAHPLLTRTFLLPRLNEFLERYPGVDLHLGQSDRYVDLVREGVDCAIRAGELTDSGMIARRLGWLDEVTCASPAYLKRCGVPASVDDLEGHFAVGFLSSRTDAIMPLEFVVDGRAREVRLPSRVTVNNSDTMAELARMGLGLIQAPRYRLRRDLAEGTLVEVLPDTPPSPTPLSVLYPQNRQMSPRLRAFIDWITGVFVEAELR